MAPSQQAERKRTANILGAFALALTDKISGAIGDVGECSPMTSAALIQIGFEPGLSIERLRMSLALTHSATVRLIDAAEASGLVQRQRGLSGDSRVAALTLTARGKTLVRNTLAAREATIAPILARLTADDIGALVRIVEKAFPAVVELGADEEVVCRLCDLDTCPQDRCPVVCTKA